MYAHMRLLAIIEILSFSRMAVALIFRPSSGVRFGSHLQNAACRLRMNTATTRVSSTPSARATSAWDVDRVRSTFIEYFADERAHSRYPSSPVVPHEDPTLLFANAGMNQFKPIFLGQADPKGALAGLRRAVNSQKCIRAGGKHNDLEDVGKDSYHHTFFEMLGTWSFGDYFKKEAIEWAWDILTRVYGLPKDRLYASYFGGDELMGLPADTEARDLWLQFLPANRVLPFDKKANFWEMGDVGPCGPCSEIHFDRIGGRDASALVNADDPDVLEIWNLVFIQFNRETDGSLSQLPSKHIDTGMGLERLVSVLQDRSSNYDTDVFSPLFRQIQKVAGGAPYGGKFGAADVGLRDTAYRVVADHARALTFAIADGATPSNEGRGYVLRRILRRAVRFGQQILKAPDGFFETLVPVVAKSFEPSFPELAVQESAIRSIVADEEQSFNRMLDRGIKYLAEVAQEEKSRSSTVIPGSKAFFLYDTMGFPIDLTQLMAAEQSLSVDMPSFEAALEEQRERSREAARSARTGGAGTVTLSAADTALLASGNVQPTDDSGKYAGGVNKGRVMAIFGPTVSSALEAGISTEAGATDDIFGVVLDTTNFYAEAGGQVGDVGELRTTGGAVLEVVDVRAYAGYVLHLGTLRKGSLKVGDTVECSVDKVHRLEVSPNHTMTHVLNHALRDVLGDGVMQRGSQVTPERLRFDFSHSKPVSPSELEKIEHLVQGVVDSKQQVFSEVIPLEQARSISSLRAVFGEAYPDPVRVISVGVPVSDLVKDPISEKWAGGSIELCGGVHVSNTADAKAFVLTEETAVAKGVRRVVALTGRNAEKAKEEGARLLSAVTAAKTSQDSSLEPIALALRQELDTANMSAALKAKLRAEVEALQRRASTFAKASAAKAADAGVNAATQAVSRAAEAGQSTLAMEVAIGNDSKAVKKIISAVQAAKPPVSFLGLSAGREADGGRLLCFTVVSEDAIAKGLRADEWLAAAMEACGGRGGGKPNAAQGQAPDSTRLKEALEAANRYAEGKMI